MYSENELYHHGILGQKWGIRRYQNYDGSLTQKGMKRYNKSLEEYNSANEKYKAAKKAYKEGTGTKADVVNKKIARNNAENKLTKDYKHLKQDKLADKGKARYAKGQTITSGKQITSAVDSVATVAGTGAAYAYKMGLLDKKAAMYIGAGAAGASLVSHGADFVNEYTRNRELRAYYAHTSNY